MPLTPLDVDNRRLRTAMRGYDRGEVDHLRAEVVASIEEYVDQIGRQRARIRELETELARFRENEETLKSAVMLAQRTADELIAAARERAGALLAQAEADADGVRRSVADIAVQREQFEYAFHGLLAGFLHRLEQENPKLARPTAAELKGSAAGVSRVSSSMDAQRNEEQPGHDPSVEIDMDDLREHPAEQIDGGETVVMPMTAPREQPPRQQPPAEPPRRDAAARGWTPAPARSPEALRTDMDADSVEFTAVLEDAGQRPETLREAQRPISGSPPHEQAEQG